MESSLYLTEAKMKEIRETVTINQEQKDIPDDLHLCDIYTVYTAIINRGLKDLNGKFTWNEVSYLLASINGSLFSNDNINLTVSGFIAGLSDFEVYDEEQAGQFGVNVNELVKTLQQEHPISNFALMCLLHQSWLNRKSIFDDLKPYIEQYLQLKQ